MKKGSDRLGFSGLVGSSERWLPFLNAIRVLKIEKTAIFYEKVVDLLCWGIAAAIAAWYNQNRNQKIYSPIRI